jgi:hypothetical protein
VVGFVETEELKWLNCQRSLIMSIVSSSVVCFDSCGLLDRQEVYQVAQSEATTEMPGLECLRVSSGAVRHQGTAAGTE